MKATEEEEIGAWFAGRVPGDWFTGDPSVSVDAEEIVVVGARPEGDDVARFREETRRRRMALAAEAQRAFGRTVSWGVRVGGSERMFTSLASPVMTRLRLRERAVLDTLVAANVARSRSEALAWCVRLVAQHEDEWLSDLREALGHVERARTEGPVAM